MTSSVEECIEALGLSGVDGLPRALTRYLAELERWNGAYNLTAVRRVEDMVSQHVADSLAVLPVAGAADRWVDVGSGAGLPGIPLALARPDESFTLIDSRGKKIRFLNHVIRELGLDNVRPVQLRAEDFRPRPGVDVIVARAFGPLARLLQAVGEWCGRKTRILAMKGGRPDAELVEVTDAFTVRAVHRLDVPGLAAERHVVEIVRA